MQPEAKITKKIREYLLLQGAFVFKIHGSPQMMSGLPDLVVCWRGKFYGIEVKQPGGIVTERQRFIHRMIDRAGGAVIVATSLDDVRDTFIV
jgi:hypothetical protein